MQTAPAPLKRRRWLRWGRVLLSGVILGLLQLLLFTQSGALVQRSVGWLFVIMSALLFLFIPAVAGFLASRHSENAPSGRGLGCLVGGIGFFVIAIPLYLIMILALPPTSGMPFFCYYQCPPPSYDPFNAATITAALIWEGVAGAVFGLLGGWFGGLLAQRQKHI